MIIKRRRMRQKKLVSFLFHFSFSFHLMLQLQEQMAGHPNNIIFLSCDAFGVLPPVAKLSSGEAMYHFMSGYTAKVAGTERGITEPQATFSTCFGAAFMTLHPTVAKEIGTTRYPRLPCQLGMGGWPIRRGRTNEYQDYSYLY